MRINGRRFGSPASLGEQKICGRRGLDPYFNGDYIIDPFGQNGWPCCSRLVQIDACPSFRPLCEDHYAVVDVHSSLRVVLKPVSEALP